MELISLEKIKEIKNLGSEEKEYLGWISYINVRVLSAIILDRKEIVVRSWTTKNRNELEKSGYVIELKEDQLIVSWN